MKLFAILMFFALSINLLNGQDGQKMDQQNTKISPDKVTEVKDTTLTNKEFSHHSMDPTDLGIGPVKELKLGPIDDKLVNHGKTIFESLCIACHSLDEKKIGPPLRNITKSHAPEYIMNMLVNTTEMEQKDPEIIKLIKQYSIPMTDLKLNQGKARAVLEYLRSEEKNDDQVKK